jgi:hypothetical protein
MKTVSTRREKKTQPRDDGKRTTGERKQCQKKKKEGAICFDQFGEQVKKC